MESRREQPETKQPHEEKRTTPEPSHGQAYFYRDSGIQERHGNVPLWLKLVSIGLIIWGIYYTVRYWSSG